MDLTDALDELVALARHMRENPANCHAVVCALDPALANMSRMEGLIATIKYHVTPREAFELPIFRPPVHVGCQFSGCIVSSKDIDACLLNFSGNNNAPMWLCRTHHPTREQGAVRAVGYTEPADKDQ